MPDKPTPNESRPSPVIDCHGHILPFLGGPAGFRSAEEHLLYVQRAMHTHTAQPVRRKRDLSPVDLPTLWNPDDPSPSGRLEVGFRTGDNNGRFEWSKDGEEYFIQFMPPSLQTMEAPAEYMIAQMDHAGIDKAVLQNDHIYGSLNEYFSDALRSYPDRFIGLAQVEEARAYQDDQIARLVRAIEHQGMSGLYFTTSTFFTTGYSPYYSDDEFDPFWNEVSRLRIPVFWVFPSSSPKGDYQTEMERFQDWLERYPQIPSVLVHGLPDGLFMRDGILELPRQIVELVRDHEVYVELLFPIKWGGKWDYPYPRAHELVRQYYDCFGPHKLMWGSDMPNVERYCTYRQTLTYLTDYCDFIPDRELTAILGNNVLGLFETG